jgi:tocopherol O-methyltransferase
MIYLKSIYLWLAIALYKADAWIPPLSVLAREVAKPSTSSSTLLSAIGIGRSLKRVRDSLTSRDRSREDLKIGIAGFYDRSSKLWEEQWGEHMHHGYYIPANRTDHKQAQVDLIDEVLKWAGVDKATRIVDVGCGIGGSSRHIARKFGCSAEGITLSPYQAGRGNELAVEQGLSGTCKFQVADALDMPFPDNSFDLVWSLESGEHMPDKQQFVNELFRVAQPGGRIIIVTWCHRDLKENETELTPSELRLLRRINRAYYLPQWCSVQDYVDLLTEKGAVDIKREDWSYIIAPFWKAVIRSSLNFKAIWGLLRAGFSTQRGAYAMFLMLFGFNKGLIKFGLLTCTKA